MPGGLIQLAAYGSENIYLMGNPQITFFKIVYKQHTNFSIEPIDIALDGIPNISEISSTSSILSIKIPRINQLKTRPNFLWLILKKLRFGWKESWLSWIVWDILKQLPNSKDGQKQPS